MVHANETTLEQRRLQLQAALDGGKTQAERNRLGQFATPTALARQILALGLHLLGEPTVRFLDPALGTGSFYSALLAERGDRSIEAALGIDMDPHYAEPARQLWAQHPLQIRTGDFTRLAASPGFNLLVCNPPYVRHHHISIEDKARLVKISSRIAGQQVSGLSGLYCHFMLLSQAWMSPGGIGLWLVPGEFMDVNYGAALKHFLLEKTTLLRVHRADPESPEFHDALVSSAVVILRNSPPPEEHRVRFSYGGSLQAPATEARLTPAELSSTRKWSRYPREDAKRAQDSDAPRLGDLFTVRRGVATGANRFFILPEQRASELGLPAEHLTPILPGPRKLHEDEVRARPDGLPKLDPLLMLVDCSLPPERLRQQQPALWDYLQTGAETVATRYLCSRRTPWYRQEQRAPPPLLCSYMGRASASGRGPFRFIRNHSRATGANVWLLLYPKAPTTAEPAFLDDLWRHLRALDPRKLLREGRVYGGGLHKLEPAELAALPLPPSLRPSRTR